MRVWPGGGREAGAKEGSMPGRRQGLGVVAQPLPRPDVGMLLCSVVRTAVLHCGCLLLYLADVDGFVVGRAGLDMAKLKSIIHTLARDGECPLSLQVHDHRTKK